MQAECYNGIINIYKEKGFTSHDVVAKMRGILKQKKIGHTGTLDPMAEGVLPVCVGCGTKLCDMLTDTDKEYRAVIRLGILTDTEDVTGTVLKSADMHVTTDEFLTAVDTFTGPYMQIPPMYSAIKKDGKKLYELAREGKEIEREARSVYINYINVEDIVQDADGNVVEATMLVGCGKGTYIRSLCRDIGERLGGFASMKALTRTKAAGFKIEDSITLAKLEEMKSNNNISDIIIGVEKVFEEKYPLYLKKEADRYIYNGNKLAFTMIQDENAVKKSALGTEFRVYDSNGKFYGIYEKKDKELMPVKMFF